MATSFGLNRGIRSVGVFVDRRLVEGIDLRRLGLSSRGADLLGHLLEALQGSTGEEDPGPPQANARATAPPIFPPAP
jgi:hypothetical protein